MADSRLKKVGYYRVDASGVPRYDSANKFLVTDESGNIGYRVQDQKVNAGFHVYPRGDVFDGSINHIKIYPGSSSSDFYRITGSGWAGWWDPHITPHGVETGTWGKFSSSS